jgi:hypothetical protein
MFARLSSRLRNVGSLYARTSEKNPHTAASLSAGGILCGADLAAQKLSGIETWDRDRTMALAAFGLIYYGGPMKWFYLRYDQFIGPGRPIFTACVDVLIQSPFFNMPCFYLITGTIKGQDLSTTVAQFRSEWAEAATGSVIYWAPMQVINFTFVPQHSRVVFASCCSFFHKLWLSRVSNRQRVAAAGGGAAVPASTSIQISSPHFDGSRIRSTPTLATSRSKGGT